MNEEFFMYTLPLLVLATMVAWDNIATERKLGKLEKRILDLELRGTEMPTAAFDANRGGKRVNEYINRNEALAAIDDYILSILQGQKKSEDLNKRLGAERAKEAVEELPAADVREVKRGKWIDRQKEPKHRAWYTCSECKGQFDYEWHFCPNCGADMRPTAEELTQGHLHLWEVNE